jgi:hypothetical protein
MADNRQQTATQAGVQQTEDADLMNHNVTDVEREDLQRLLADGDEDNEGSEESGSEE